MNRGGCKLIHVYGGVVPDDVDFVVRKWKWSGLAVVTATGLLDEHHPHFFVHNTTSSRIIYQTYTRFPLTTVRQLTAVSHSVHSTNPTRGAQASFLCETKQILEQRTAKWVCAPMNRTDEAATFMFCVFAGDCRRRKCLGGRERRMLYRRREGLTD